MKPRIILNSFIALLLVSCSDYSDHKLIYGELDAFNVLDSSNIEISIKGNEDLTYEIELFYKDELIYQSSISSNFKGKTTSLKFDYSKLNKRVLEFSHDVFTQQYVDLKVVASNAEHRKFIDSIIPINFLLPPISEVKNVDIEKGSITSISAIQEPLIEVRKKFGAMSESKKYKIAFLMALLKSQSHGLHSSEKIKTINPLKSEEKIKVSVTTDTTFNHTVIVCYPAINNGHYDDIDLEKIIRESINSKLDGIESDWKGIKKDGYFIIEDELSSSYTGLVGIYLINIDRVGQITYQQIGCYLSDALSPKFKNSKYCSEPEYSNIEGVVCLDSETFYGLRTKIPFVGYAFGDIKKIYVNNQLILFVKGEEIYQKVFVSLSMGYNRVPIKLVDNSGNITESYIPITMEYDNDTDINIDNNIDIDNY